MIYKEGVWERMGMAKNLTASIDVQERLMKTNMKYGIGVRNIIGCVWND